MSSRPTDWGYAAGISEIHAAEYLRAAITDLIKPILRAHPIKEGFCAITGFDVSEFTFVPIDGLQAPSDSIVNGNISNVSNWIRQNEAVPSSPTYCSEGLLLPLTGMGELFGFIILTKYDSSVNHKRLEEEWAIATSRIADFNYSRRVIALASPLIFDEAISANLSEDAFLNRVARITALSFGSDAALVRLYNPDEDCLRIAAFEGLLSEDFVSIRARGEALSGTVLASNSENWALVELNSQVTTKGAALPSSSVKYYKEHGIRAALCARMDEPLVALRRPIGTICYLFYRANSFSWRDVALFVSFTKRVADSLCLIRQTARLQERTKILEIQAPVFTQAELAHLLVHDLSHKVLDIEGEGSDLIYDVRKELRRFRENISREITDRFEKFQESIEVLKKEVVDLRAVGRLEDKNDEILASTYFDAVNETKYVVNLMMSAFNRQKITPNVISSGEAGIVGPVKVFHHILLNFIINTIDAAKGRSTQRPMTMTFAISSDPSFVKIKIWDTGPGIDMSRFKTAEEVFKIGKTTKPRGTGMGLPVARTLFDRYFKGSIQLLDPRTATFELTARHTIEK